MIERKVQPGGRITVHLRRCPACGRPLGAGEDRRQHLSRGHEPDDWAWDGSGEVIEA